MSDETGLIQHTSQPRDLHSMAMAGRSPADIQAGLNEIGERRNTIRAWLLSQMEEGVHYGFPPGCRSEDKGKAWKAKCSLYKAGAELVAEVMGLRAEYRSDELTWRMMGEPKDTFFRICTLYSVATGAVVGHGTGARKNGAKGMDINASLKMADKAALVAAIISTYSLSDLFTQDLEDLQPEPHRNPEPSASAPKVQPRAARSKNPPTNDEMRAAYAAFQDHRDALGLPHSVEDFSAWVDALIPEVLKRGKINDRFSWEKSEIDRVHDALRKERGGK